MHARIVEDGSEQDPLQVFLDVATLISEARVPGLGHNGRGYGEGPHCPLPYASVLHAPAVHTCTGDQVLCQRQASLRRHALLLWQNGVALCVEVLAGPECAHAARCVRHAELAASAASDPNFLLIERWIVSVQAETATETGAGLTGLCLVQAVRSYLHFSQLSAWLNKSAGAHPHQLLYRVKVSGPQAFTSGFRQPPVEHHFPSAQLGHQRTHRLKVSVCSLPRTETIPRLLCHKCQAFPAEVDPVAAAASSAPTSLTPTLATPTLNPALTPTAETTPAPPPSAAPAPRTVRMRSRSASDSPASRRLHLAAAGAQRKGQHLDHRRNATLGSDCPASTSNGVGVDVLDSSSSDDDDDDDEELIRQMAAKRRGLQLRHAHLRPLPASQPPSRTESVEHRGRSQQRRSRKDAVTSSATPPVPPSAPPPAPPPRQPPPPPPPSSSSSSSSLSKAPARTVPTSDDRLRFQKSLNSAASLVFHAALGAATVNKFLRSPPLRMTSSPLLGSFEESLLNGRLEPMSTVEGFRAELGASGSFCPSHQLLPVSVFFYSFGGLESDKTGSPYLAHVNLGAGGGYQVPRRGTVQLTLFNPQGTVVKMFVVLFDLTHMPPNSKTFLRQRTYYMPGHETDQSPQAPKWLRYLIHLRFCSSKTGRIYLHTDVRIIVLRKSDLDTASAHLCDLCGGDSYEWKSFTRGPSEPRFSTR